MTPSVALRRLTALALLVFCGPLAVAQAPTVLFIRGGPGTGGFLEGGSDEQLSDITNASTAAGNHGWSQLADTLRAAGFALEQIIEGPADNNTPIDFTSLDLEAYAVIVLGSNNATYPTESVDAVDQFVRNGGGLLVISDANWGRNWGDAPTSDQAFLDRYGLIMNQDRGTYVLDRADGDFVVDGNDQGDHPILTGVAAFDGEGVSPLTLGDPMDDLTVRVLANAEGFIRINDNDAGGSSRKATSGDGALVVVEAGAGRVAGHFDRNTFFNANGAGTDLTRFSNARYARQLFGWLAGTLTTLPEPPPDARATFVRGPFPNPSKGTVRFQLDLSTPQRVRAEVFDLQGRRVFTVLDEVVMPDRTLSFSTRSLPTGTYYVQIRGEDFDVARAFQVVR